MDEAAIASDHNEREIAEPPQTLVGDGDRLPDAEGKRDRHGDIHTYAAQSENAFDAMLVLHHLYSRNTRNTIITYRLQKLVQINVLPANCFGMDILTVKNLELPTLSLLRSTAWQSLRRMSVPQQN